MSFVTYNALKAVARAYQLRTDRDVQMFGDLWEVYQVGNDYRRRHASALRAAVERSYTALAALARGQLPADPPPGFRRVSSTQQPNLVIFSDHHLTPRGHRHDYFYRFNMKLYCEVLRRYADRGFSLVENGDVEELVVFEPTPELTAARRALVKKSLLQDIGSLTWDELVQARIRTRKRQLADIIDDNAEYYELLERRFGPGRYHKIAGNHDTFYEPELEAEIEERLWKQVVTDVLRVELEPGQPPSFLVTHGHQFDEACVPPHATQVGETISECLAWAFQGADRIWRASDTRRWTSGERREFSNRLSAARGAGAAISGHPELEAMLEAFMGHQVAWEYFENRDPYRAFVEEVCTGDEFFKYRHLDEEALANALLERLSGERDFPVVICGHSHEPRDRSTFDNRSGTQPPQTRDPNLFTRYMNTGSAGRFENLVWCVEIHRGHARVVSWCNAGSGGEVRPQRTVWESDDRGKLIGTPRGE